MLKIRLSRTGKKNAPSYRVVLQESQKDPKSQAKEILGFYNPRSKEKKLEGERIQYWVSKGAQCSATANNLFIKEGILKEAKKMRSTHMNAKKRAKLADKNKAKQEKIEVAKKEANKEVPNDEILNQVQDDKQKEEVKTEENK